MGIYSHCFSPDGLYLAGVGDCLVCVSPLFCPTLIPLNLSRCGKYLRNVSGTSSYPFTQTPFVLSIVLTSPLMAVSLHVASIHGACKFGTVAMVPEGFSNTSSI